MESKDTVGEELIKPRCPPQKINSFHLLVKLIKKEIEYK